MGFACGLIGLPNVGKSTLFNALMSRAVVAAENYPFCTIEPHRERVPVPDERLAVLSSLVRPANVVEAQLELVDIAGLVRGASVGEGLGNRFLQHIRDVHVLVHVVRCFEGEDITHVDGRIDPMGDIDTIETELMLADIGCVTTQRAGLEKRARARDKDAIALLAQSDIWLAHLDKGHALRSLPLEPQERHALMMMGALTMRPVIYVCNVTEGHVVGGFELSQRVHAWANEQGLPCITISAALEQALASFSPQERKDYLEALGVEDTGLSQLIRAGYSALGLHTFFTAGDKEVRAWTCQKGASAVEAAAVIHSDFAQGFICAETISYGDYKEWGSHSAAAQAGKVRKEGRDYIVCDGDVMLFRFHVAKAGKAKK
ncbi:MAG: redox-regulated ATPase YchF [Alphaproteobacteria bacterium GM7ARS4]|nr:redox-regulated ATPase YchF [Alphaproteobacteria bacterium GM7ARS4]